MTDYVFLCIEGCHVCPKSEYKKMYIGEVIWQLNCTAQDSRQVATGNFVEESFPKITVPDWCPLRQSQPAAATLTKADLNQLAEQDELFLGNLSDAYDQLPSEMVAMVEAGRVTFIDAMLKLSLASLRCYLIKHREDR